MPRSWIYPDDTCGEDKKQVLETEIGYAREMAETAARINIDDLYFDTFISEWHKTDQASETQSFLSVRYTRMAKMLTLNENDYEIKITCDNGSNGCKKKDFVAHMNDGTQTINFCDKFFQTVADDRSIKPTKERLDNCANINLKQAQWSRASVIVHECSHINHVMQGEGI